RAGIIFPGGIDPLACLRLNRLSYPLKHPRSIKDGLLIFRIEANQSQGFEQVVISLSDLAQDAGITLIPVYTNLRCLDDDWVFWRDEFHGAFLAAVAHAFRQRLTVVSIPAHWDIPNL